MICNICKKEIENGTVVCPFCGALLAQAEERIIEVGFKKPDPPPVIEVLFVEPEVIEAEPEYIEPEYIEPEYIEPEYVEPEYVEPEYVEPVVEEPVYVEPSKPKKKKASKKEKPKKEKKKSKDKLNFFYLLLSLMWAPYPGIMLWVSQSKKAPKASGVYGICAIVMYLIRVTCDIITRAVVNTVAVILVIVFAAGSTVVLYMIQFGQLTLPV